MKYENINFAKYTLPIKIAEDTEFIDCNLLQPLPHSNIFDVIGSPQIHFYRCNLVNVTCPEGATIEFCNNAQITYIEYPDKPTVALLHECEKCATFTKALRESIKNKEYHSHKRLDLIKPKARERRLDLKIKNKDIEEIKAENEEALQSYHQEFGM